MIISSVQNIIALWVTQQPLGMFTKLNENMKLLCFQFSIWLTQSENAALMSVQEWAISMSVDAQALQPLTCREQIN